MLGRLVALGLGALLCLVLLEVLLSLGYRGFVAWQMQRNQVDLTAGADEVRILALGESTTAVAGDEKGTMLVPRTSWPAQLQDVLAQRQSAVDFRVLNNGIMGGTSSEILDLLDITLPVLKPQVIIVMMGIKDTPDERMPGLTGLPPAVAHLKTVQLACWLLESWRLRQQAAITDIDSIDDLPEADRDKMGAVGNLAKEIRLAGDQDAIDQVRVVIYLWYVGRLEQAEVLARKLVDDRDVGWSVLAQLVHSAGRRDEGKQILRDAMARHPDEGMYPAVLAELLVRDQRYDEAQAVLDATLATPQAGGSAEAARSYALAVQADLLLTRGRPDAAADAARQMLGDTPLRLQRVVPSLKMLRAAALGRAAIATEQWEEAEEQLLAALEADPRLHVNMWLLSQVYRQTGQTAKEEEIRRQLLKTTGRMAEYMELARLFRLTGHPERVPEVLAEAVEQIPSLKQNYARLYEIAEREGIRLVVMQYPGFSIDALKAYAPPGDNITYIDNQDIFASDPDRYFFEPTFPQSFTHYTQEGAHLVAEHVADTVIEMYGLDGAVPAGEGR